MTYSQPMTVCGVDSSFDAVSQKSLSRVGVDGRCRFGNLLRRVSFIVRREFERKLTKQRMMHPLQEENCEIRIGLD